MSKLDLDALERVTVADLKDVMNYEDTLEDSIETRIRAALGISCLICGDIFPRSCIETFYLCDHQCCTDCLRGYYQGVFAEITDANSLSKLTCYEAHDLPNDPDIRLNFFPHLENLVYFCWIIWSHDRLYESMNRLDPTPVSRSTCFARPISRESFLRNENNRNAQVYQSESN